jgi:hypothetical protein
MVFYLARLVWQIFIGEGRGSNEEALLAEHGEFLTHCEQFGRCG